jgi:hypothetical protein
MILRSVKRCLVLLAFLLVGIGPVGIEVAVWGDLSAKAAVVKDGPFPMYQATGHWVSQKGYVITISTGAFTPCVGVQVDVVVKDRKGNIVLRGAAIHPMEDEDLVVFGYSGNNKPVEIRFWASYLGPNEGRPRPFILRMSTKYVETERVEVDQSVGAIGISDGMPVEQNMTCK